MIDLKDVQKQVYQNKVDKGFNVTDVSMEFALTYGELSEAYQSWWKKKGDVGEELADVMIYLLGLSEILGIDLESELLAKVKKNADRKYEVKDGIVKRISDF